MAFSFTATGSAAIAATDSMILGGLSFRWLLAGLLSTPSFFGVEDFVERGFDVASVAAFGSSTGAGVSSAILRVFFEDLLDCMRYILPCFKQIIYLLFSYIEQP